MRDEEDGKGGGHRLVWDPTGVTSPLERIVVLAHASVLDRSGYARRVVDSAQALRRALPTTSVVVASFESPSRLRDREARRAVQAELQAASVGFAVLHAWPRRLGLARLSDRLAARALARWCRRNATDVVHAHGPRASRAAIRSAKGTDVRVVADVHGDRAAERRLEAGTGDDRGTVPDPLESSVVDEANAAVFASEALAERFQVQGRPFAVVPCLVPDARIPTDDVAEGRRRERRAAWGIGDDVWVAAYAGSLASWQEFPRVARVVAHLTSRVPQLRFLVLTPSKAQAAEALARAGVPRGRFVVLSPRSEEVVDHLLAADGAILCRREALANTLAFPTKFAEYLAAGLEVVASDAVPAVAGRIASTEGLGRVLSPSKDDATWAAALAGASRPSSPAERASRRAFARAHLAWSCAIPSYATLYEAV